MLSLQVTALSKIARLTEDHVMSLNASSDGSGLDLKQENPSERNIYNLKRSRPKADGLLNPISANASVRGRPGDYL